MTETKTSTRSPEHWDPTRRTRLIPTETLGCFVPPRGYSLQPRVSTRFQPWEPTAPPRRALKGRQIESTNAAKVGSKVSNCGTSHLYPSFCANDGCENKFLNSKNNGSGYLL